MTPKEMLAHIQAEIERLEERKRLLYRISVDSPPEEKLCDDALARMLGEPDLSPRFTYPIEVHGITHTGEVVGRSFSRRYAPGAWVAVRPCAEDARGKTYLGVYLGDLALGAGASFHRATGVLEIRLGHHNPAIWVPDLKRIVFGAESWWGVLEGPEDLRQISDADIQNIWYVQALKSLGGAPPAAPAPEGP